ncbi:DNA polymerase III subunit beta [Chitinasiproducens palmae]|uniref:Beta sliding clamp n=1 Tax=Chitinasiproducens palmae TaxID=1770053 RepID=A0A1H2PNX9_9BURK|nr:DNA polymerase III subunit beta [Chitinasiproducens palmae]SDV48421.1 DNA polymerase III, beta subunit [Chitinasiproducens palmae]
MQLAKTERDLLLRPLQTVAGIVERRHTLPILANLLIRKQGEELSFVSTDLELQITTRAPIASGGEDASTTVAARKLLDIVRTLPFGDTALSLNDKKLTVQCGRSRFALQTLAADDFPTLALAPNYGPQLTIQQREFKHLLGLVHFAMAQQDVRYYLNGMLLVIEGASLTAVATDGHRLAMAAITLDAGEHPRQEVIVPRKAILELQRLLEESVDPLTIELAPSQARFTFGDTEVISKLVEGKFPDYQRVIPKGYKNTFSVGREELQRALQRAAILTSDKFKGVHLLVSPGQISIRSNNSEQEEAQDEIEIAYDGDTIDIGFNVSYLLDILANVKNDMFEISLGDANSSALLSLPEDDKQFKYVVMPMRI